ncbi:Putative Mg2+ and Co2+ transporter CorB [Metamycoplasma arthritidis]|uniref:Uncharacterized protein n=1 Tax=Metamycoplasma arthritidis (strain 158L3-1) TaxID=243272 RepID=B3PN61_META1|nr:hemolysin family protein [Metamycoplasma arthritidis]ACF07463.1 conserved hypothetical protein [Metamycoplasma arthritidis 158L3-1]VEU78984.1 Putative Mg2+ and Co2+ transporter CorB [Metamycoplasma arthritidis]
MPSPTPWHIYLIEIIAILVLLISSAIFSSCETAYTSVGSAKIQSLIDNKKRGAKLIQKQHANFNRTLSVVLLGNNLVNILGSVLLSLVLNQAIPNKDGLVLLISTLVMTPITVIFAEIIPKLVAKAHPVGVIKTFYWFIETLYWIFFPISYPISKLGKRIYITNTEEEVKSLLNVAKNEGVLEINESSMAKNALDLDSTKVSQHYIKLKNVDYIMSHFSLAETLAKFKETKFSRLPIKKDDNLIGIILLRDIFFLKKGNIMNYIKTVPNISANSTLSSALEKMRRSQAQMAFVVENNSSEKVIGIITIEDILEEVVGEIYDEYDTDETIYEISLEKCRAKGMVTMKDLWKQLELAEVLNLELPDNEEDQKLFNWFSEQVGHKPRLNTKLVYKDLISFKLIEKVSKTGVSDIFEIDWSK